MHIKDRIREIEDMLWTYHNVPLVSALSRNEMRLLQEELRSLYRKNKSNTKLVGNE